MALSSKVGIDVKGSFVSRFPDHCPYCVSQPCACFKTGKRPVEAIPAYKLKGRLENLRDTFVNSIELSDRKLDLDLAVATIENIYPNNEVIWKYAGPWHHFAKLQEEVAEVHEAFAGFSRDEKPLSAFGQEVADVLGWILGMWAILRPGQSLDEEFISYYYEGCPVCGQIPCCCSSYNSRPEGLVDVTLLREVQRQVIDLLQFVPAQQAALEKLAASLETAAETQDEAIANASISETRSKLESIKEGLDNADEVGKKGLSLIATILKLVEKVSDFL
jgi:hypothetical protein